MIDAEQSLIGALLLDNRAWDRVADLVKESDLYRDDHRRIFRRMALLCNAGKPADVITVADALERAGELEQAGGLAYVAELANNTPSSANVRRYAEMVRERAMLRGMKAIAVELEEACANPSGKTPQEIAAAAETSMLALLDEQADEPAELSATFVEALRYIDARSDTGGLATGVHDFDALTGGLEPGQLVILAARPSVGKTVMGCNIADHVARAGGSVLFFTLEMGRREIGMRIMSARSGVSVHSMRSGTKDVNEWQRMNEQVPAASNQRLWIDDKPAVTVPYIRARARRMKRKAGWLDLIVIDYLQLMKGEGDNRTQEIGSISRGLKALAKELQVPIIALAQLNRGVESRTDKRPMMSDLRDSGEVEQDADIVAMLHREQLYSDRPEWVGFAELLVRKNRNGPTGEVLLSYWPQEMRFAEFTGPNPRRFLSENRATSKNNRGGFE